jgi:hypothetical protein
MENALLSLREGLRGVSRLRGGSSEKKSPRDNESAQGREKKRERKNGGVGGGGGGGGGGKTPHTVRHSPGGKAPKENERQRVGPVGGGVTKLRTGKGAAGKRSKDHMILARYGSFLNKKKEKVERKI